MCPLPKRWSLFIEIERMSTGVVEPELSEASWPYADDDCDDIATLFQDRAETSSPADQGQSLAPSSSGCALL